MNLLLDSHLLLWVAADPEKLSAEAVTMINSDSNQLYFSAVSIWEVVIKNALQRESFYFDPHLLKRGLVDNGYQELPITSAHSLGVAHLPPIHKDPFDRMLVAQAEFEGFLLLTSDAVVAQYPGPVRLV